MISSLVHSIDGSFLAWLRTVPPYLFDALAAAGIALVVVSWFRRTHSGDGRLVDHLARQLRLSAADRRLLRRMANAAALPTASSLLLSRGCFDHAANALAARDGWTPRVDRLRSRAFPPSEVGVPGESQAGVDGSARRDLVRVL